MINNIENLTRMKHLDSKFTRFSKAKSNEVEVGEVDFKQGAGSNIITKSWFWSLQGPYPLHVGLFGLK